MRTWKMQICMRRAHALDCNFPGCRAIAAAEAAAPAMAALGSYQRKEVLEHCVREFKARFEELAMSLCIEAGKPIKARYTSLLVAPRCLDEWQTLSNRTG